jgi:hypothetical protein
VGLLAVAGGRPRAAELPPGAWQRLLDSNPHAGHFYFVDFRSGLDSITGHSYIVYGRLDRRGRLLSIQHADMFPEDKDIGLFVGLFLPVRAEIGVKNGDSRREAVISYRRYPTADQFARMMAAIRRERIIDRRWNLLLFNCNDFTSHIAESIGLRTPSALLLPHAYVAALRALNGRIE